MSHIVNTRLISESIKDQKMNKILPLLVLILQLNYSEYGQDLPKMRTEDKIRIKEAIYISTALRGKYGQE
jgi:hypothetical protein